MENLVKSVKTRMTRVKMSIPTKHIILNLPTSKILSSEDAHFMNKTRFDVWIKTISEFLDI